MMTKQKRPPSSIEEVARYFIDQMDDAAPTMSIGPLVWDPDGAVWYFVVAGSTADDGFFLDGVMTPGNQAAGEEMRSGLYWALINGRRGIVLRDFDDELEMARWNAVIWPCEKSRSILENMRLEHAEPGGSA